MVSSLKSENLNINKLLAMLQHCLNWHYTAMF